jgi:hypothetical protein
MTARRLALLGVLLAGGASALLAAPASARPTDPVVSRAELSVPKAACGVAGVVNKAIGIACGALSNGGALIKGAKQLLHGNVGGAVTSVLGGGAGTVAATAGTAIGLAAIGVWVVGGAGAVLHEAAAALGATTRPQLDSTWFSSTYWRMAAIATMLTLPFLFAATVQAALRSDVALLARAALGYLPLAILSIAIAAPLATLLLAASDEMCSLISSAAGNESSHVITTAAAVVAGLTALARSPFLAFLVALFAIGAGFTLWIELLLREAAVYVVVLMLPLAFAALAWPARRVWAVRAVEILVALILSKFAIVAVLSLGGAAIGASIGHLGVSRLMAGTVLIMLAALSPWVLLRFVPLAEVAAGAAGALRGELRGGRELGNRAVGEARSADDWVSRTTSGMRRDAAVGVPDLEGPTRSAGTARGGSTGAGGGGDVGGDNGGGDLGGGDSGGGEPGRGDLGGGDPGGGSPAPPEPGAPDPIRPGTPSAGARRATTVGGPATPPSTDASPPPPADGSGRPAGPPGPEPPAGPRATEPPAAPAPAEPPAGPRATEPPAAPAPVEPPPSPAEPPPNTRDVPWSQRSVLELGPNFGDTVVWPHEDAE